jgi:hypothetical protein
VDHLEVSGPGGRELVALERRRVVVGSSPECDVVVRDATVSQVHAVLDRVSAVWTVRDVGSSNGTYVNGKRITGEWRLRAGDEVRLGTTRLVLKGSAPAAGATATLAEPPRLTGRERDVLVELCRPFSTGGAFSEPATVHEIARALVVTDPAVKHHLANLYDKFEIAEGPRRRARLANAALTTGAVGMADFRAAAG